MLSSEIEGLCQQLHRNQRWDHPIHTAGSCLHPTAKPKLLQALNKRLDREDAVSMFGSLLQSTVEVIRDHFVASNYARPLTCEGVSKL